MVVWAIYISWNGQIKEKQDVVPSGVPIASEKSLRELFDRIQKVDGFERAFDAVYGMMKAGGGTYVVDGAEAGGERHGKSLGRRKGMKRMKFT